MQTWIGPATLAAIALPLAGCDKTPEAREQPLAQEQVAIPVEPDGGIGDGAGPPAAAPDEATDGMSGSAATIPAAIQGRWGLTANDCHPSRSDNKGLLTVSDRKLEFYESVGTLDTVQEREPTRVRATFSFTGEGMNWERGVVLDVQDDGEVLIRREYGADAAPGPFRYSKCA